MGIRLKFPGEGNKAIGLPAHGRNHYYDLMAARLKFGDTARDIFYPLRASNRCAAVFLNNKCHDRQQFDIEKKDTVASIMSDQFNVPPMQVLSLVEPNTGISIGNFT